MAIPSLSLNFPGDPPSFCCPVCGHKVFVENAAENADEGLCEHIVFLGETISGEWQWNNDVYEKAFNLMAPKIFEKLENKDEYEDLDEGLSDLDVVAKIACEAIDSESAFLLNVTTYGMGCGGGPTAGAVYAIVDYYPEEEEE